MLVVGEHRDFKFGVQVNHSKSHPRDDNCSWKGCGHGHVTSKFWEIIDTIFEMVQHRDSYNGRLTVWPIKWHDCQWPWVRLKVTFTVLNPCNTHNSGNTVCLSTVCLQINWKAHAACDLNFTVKGEGLFKVTGSPVHWKSGNISETVLDRDVTTGH